MFKREFVCYQTLWCRNLIAYTIEAEAEFPPVGVALCPGAVSAEAVAAFGISWLTKGEAILRDQT